MTSFAAIKRHVIEYLDRYFADALSAIDLHDRALAHPTFANPKALNNALALMIALTDKAEDSRRGRRTIETGTAVAGRRTNTAKRSFASEFTEHKEQGRFMNRPYT